jgi:hypothetical protein
MSTNQQRVIWTACPNGIASNGKLRISVAIGPQLLAAKSPATLAGFPDFADWPAAKITWQVVIGSDLSEGTVVSAAPSSALYTALFRPSTPVDTFIYSSPTAKPLISYPSAFMHQFFAGLYGQLATSLPAGGGLHSVDDLFRGSALGQLPPSGRELGDLVDNALGLLPANGGPVPVRQTQNVSTAIGLATALLAPPPPASGIIPNEDESAAALPPVPVPEFDFHNAYSLIQRHPALLRLFGFVVDLEVPRPAELAGTVGLSVNPHWTPKLGAGSTVNVSPVTMTTAATWLPAPRGTSPEIAGGLLRLSDKGAYEVLEMDVDGATLKTLNFVQAVANAQGPRRSADTPTSYGVPALRSAGLSLSKIGNADSVYQNWLDNNVFAAAAGANPPQPVTLFAEDLAQGYRVDVFESSRGRWFQLCARSAAPKPVGLGGYGIGKPPHVVPVPAGDEGWIEPVTSEPQNAHVMAEPPVTVPETLLRWSGWSLIASRPGKHLTDDSADSLAAPSGNAPPANAHFQLQVEYAATRGTLPTLRFGSGYRFRARVVDLAGNSLPFEPHASFTQTTAPVTYGRLEPVASPVIVPCAPRTPGESLERLVIRSNFDIPDDSPQITACERHLAPPASSVELLETHGALDVKGVPDKAAYAMLAGRDGVNYATAEVVKRFGGKHDDQPLNAGQTWLYYPPRPKPSASEPAFGVPYLPDVLGRGVSLLGLPGAGAGHLMVPFDAGRWPNRRSVRLVVQAGSKHPGVPPAGEADGAITVFAPKASVSTVRLSSYFAADQLGSLKLWQWLEAGGHGTAALKKQILDGGHYMLTPFRELTIVHAVRQPLTAPQVRKLTSDRSAGATYTLLTGSLAANPPSSQRVDVLSVYTDPIDDGSSPQGAVDRQTKARVAEIELASDQSGTIAVRDLRQDFGDTKHHEVFYQLLATTRFAEYFTETVIVKLAGSKPVVVSHAGFAPGTVTVKGTGKKSSVTYLLGVDYAEDDQTGSLARITSGSITAGAEVEVQFVAPPITRSSLEKAAKPPTASGFRLSVPSSARPPAPDVRYLVPAFSWDRKTTSSVRHGNLLRVYLGRPWFESGAGELLGVVIPQPTAGSGLPTNILPLTSGYGSDPVFNTGSVVTPSASDFKLAVAVGKELLLAEQSDATPWVNVAGHKVAFDSQRGLWYSDIEISAGASYFPFVKLALVRYQPGSLAGLELSRVVQADFLQIAPDRSLSLSFPSAKSVQVTVTGPAYQATSDPDTADLIRAEVQEATIQTSDDNLRWTTVPAGSAGVVLKVISDKASGRVWQGKVTLPAARGTKKFRIAVTEFEQHKVVQTGNLEFRVVYTDAIEI